MARVNKEKQKETLDKMKETRAKDYVFLRDILSQKLTWAQDQIKQGQDAILAHEKKTKELKEQVLRLEGSIIMIKEVMNKVPEEDKNNDTPSD